MKVAELELRHHDLTTEYYKDDPWIKQVVGILESQIKEIERYMKEGGELNIGKCMKEKGTCGLTYKRFDLCGWWPKTCDFHIDELTI